MKKKASKKLRPPTRQQRLEKRESFRVWLTETTKCGVQGGFTLGRHKDSGWPCGTCFMFVLTLMGLDGTKPEYKDHNPEIERHNEVWRAVLQIRDTKI